MPDESMIFYKGADEDVKMKLEDPLLDSFNEDDELLMSKVTENMFEDSDEDELNSKFANSIMSNQI